MDRVWGIGRQRARIVIDRGEGSFLGARLTILSPLAAILPLDSRRFSHLEARVGHAADVWGQLTSMMESADLKKITDLYEVDALFLEPYNPPHRGNLLIQAYLKDYLGSKEEVDIDEKRVVESEDGRTLAVEWTISYTAGGRRWQELPRASFLEFDDDGLITYHRDYT